MRATACLLIVAVAGCSSDRGPLGVVPTFGIGSPDAAELAADAFDETDPDQQRRAVMRLANSPDGDREPHLRVYRQLLTDSDPTVQAACARALGRHGQVEDAPRLTTLLDHENTFVRWEAAKALQRIHNPAVTDNLIDALQQDSDTDVRIAAAKALGQYPQPAVFDALVGALDGGNYSVSQQARDSLRTLTGHQGGVNPSTWLEWAKAHRGELFANQQRYTYRPYDRGPSWLERARFWANDPRPPGRRPRGLDVAGKSSSPDGGA